jgi:predicted esterase
MPPLLRQPARSARTRRAGAALSLAAAAMLALSGLAHAAPAHAPAPAPAEPAQPDAAPKPASKSRPVIAPTTPPKTPPPLPADLDATTPRPATAAPTAGAFANLAGKRAAANRLDVALELLKLEQSLVDASRAGRLVHIKLAEVNKAFDSLTGLFFAGRNAEAIEKLQQLEESLADAPRSDLQKALDACKLEIDPPLWTTSFPAAAEVPEGSEPKPALAFRLRQLHGGGEVNLLAGRTVRIIAEPATPGPGTPAQVELGTIRIAETVGEIFRFEQRFDAAAAGKLVTDLLAKTPADNLRIGLVLEGTPVRRSDVNRVQLLAEPLTAMKQRALGQLDKISPGTVHELTQATLRSRIGLASRAPASNEAGKSLLSLGALAREIDGELSQIAAGKDPYADRAGTWQFTLDEADGSLPVWVHAGKRQAQAPGLLIALHGAGGDEAMFPLSYGAGAARDLCERNNLVLVSPKTEPLMSTPALLDKVIARASHHYGIDSTRIYVLGHSMGAITASSLATQRPLTIAAAVCIAGGPSGIAPTSLLRLPPMLVIGAELDNLVAPSRLRPAAERWAAAGLPVTFKLSGGTGHTLCVGYELTGAINWLTRQRMPGAAAAFEPANPEGNK